MTSSRLFAVLLFAGGIAQADDWHYSIGVHDFQVPQADSDTFGINATATYDHRTDSGWHLFGSADVFRDFDEDHLDPDHIPIWWQVHAGTDGRMWESGSAHVDWTADINSRVNTVSSIERRHEGLAALVAGVDGDLFQGSMQAGAGWLFLEIDDDVPKTRGYTRDDLRNTTFAYSLAARGAAKFGASSSAAVSAQGWWDHEQTLQTEYEAELRFGVDQVHKGSQLVLSADYNEYNLDHYARAGLPPILPWDHDLMFRVLMTEAW